MNRGLVAGGIKDFYDLLVCAQVADIELLEKVYLELSFYIEELKVPYDAIDEFTLKDLSEVFPYHHFNKRYIIGAKKLKLFSRKLSYFLLDTGPSSIRIT